MYSRFDIQHPMYVDWHEIWIRGRACDRLLADPLWQQHTKTVDFIWEWFSPWLVRLKIKDPKVAMMVKLKFGGDLHG